MPKKTCIKNSKFIIITITGLISISLIFNACKKEETNTTYRITNRISYHNGEKWKKMIYEYDNNKIVESKWHIHNQNGDWEENSKSIYEYPEKNTIIEINYWYINNLWERSVKIVSTYEGGKNTERVIYRYNENEWGEKMKHTWKYTNEKVSEYYFYTYNNNDWDVIGKEEAVYDDSNLLEVKKYNYVDGIEENNYKTIFTYDGGEVENKISYNYKSGYWEKSWKNSFEYSSGNVTHTSLYDYDAGSWKQFGTVTYEYDENGNYINREEIYIGDIYHDNINYEKGSGNYKDLVFEYEIGYYNIRPLPTKTPNKKMNPHRSYKQFGIK